MPVKMGMTLLLSLFFDDYGFPNLWAWVIYFILFGITVACFWIFSSGRKKEGIIQIYFAFCNFLVFMPIWLSLFIKPIWIYTC